MQSIMGFDKENSVDSFLNPKLYCLETQPAELQHFTPGKGIGPQQQFTYAIKYLQNHIKPKTIKWTAQYQNHNNLDCCRQAITQQGKSHIEARSP